MAAAIAACGPGEKFSAIGDAIEAVARRARMSVVREMVGHGVGRAFHSAPSVLHFKNSRPETMQVGQTFTIEPILTLGSRKLTMWPDGWTLVTRDGSLAAQFEHTVLITQDGAEVLTEVGDEEAAVEGGGGGGGGTAARRRGAEAAA